MTKKEINKLKELFNTLEKAYYIIGSASIDYDADKELVFGTPASPTYASEEHIHLYNGDIIDIRLKEDKIIFRNSTWMNAFGEKIWGVIRLNHFDGTNAIIETRKGFKKDYRPTIIYPCSYYSDFTGSYLDIVENKVLEYLLKIDITTLKHKTKELATLKGKYEFGRDLENQNYYQTIKSTKLIKGEKTDV